MCADEAATNVVAAGYDAVYTALPNAPTLRRIWRQHASGEDYPEGFEAISLVTRSGLERIAAELRVGQGQTFVDAGCGTGGPALWVARETGARLIGVDLSSAAVAAAGMRAKELGLAAQARFVAGSFAETGLDDAAAEAYMSLDALQYAPDKRAAVAEAARVLVPGGRLVFTAFELDRAKVVDLPIIGVDPVEDYQPLLAAGGFAVQAYEQTPAWPANMMAACEAIMAAETTLRVEMGEAAWLALAGEVSLTLQRQPYRRHVFVVATKC